QPVVDSTNPKNIETFMQLRFGMFIHWGPVTLRATEIGWSRNHEVTRDDYDSLYKEFDPVLFNAEDWVRTARDAGMKYLTITAKHHDGFCLWPTKYTAYNIKNSPYKKDIVGALARACKKYNIRFCIYYTVLDWYDQRYPLHNDGKKLPDPDANMDAFVQYMKNQLRELVTSYRPYMIWFDGNWEQPWTLDYGKEIYRFLKQLDPGLVINNRLGKGVHEIMGNESVGDFATPEQKIGTLNRSMPWESCITLCRQWAWKPNDAMKSLKQCIQTLASTAGGDGNLLLNIGPMPDGRIESRQVKRLKEVGHWLRLYGTAIYNTRGGPYTPDSVLATTCKDNKIFIHLFKKESAIVKLPAITGKKLAAVYFLNGNPLQFRQTESEFLISLPEVLPDENDTVIVLEMDGNVMQIPVVSRTLH
ncbi:MAG TPA: alpha-L-fucosidase, partial [Niabella sp.]